VVILKAAKEYFKQQEKFNRRWLEDPVCQKISARQSRSETIKMMLQKTKTAKALPDLKKGDDRIIADAAFYKKNKTPAAYTEATLLQAMETAGNLL
jgi:DNA topoisomerase IA